MVDGDDAPVGAGQPDGDDVLERNKVIAVVQVNNIGRGITDKTPARRSTSWRECGMAASRKQSEDSASIPCSRHHPRILSVFPMLGKMVRTRYPRSENCRARPQTNTFCAANVDSSIE